MDWTVDGALVTKLNVQAGLGAVKFFASRGSWADVRLLQTVSLLKFSSAARRSIAARPLLLQLPSAHSHVCRVHNGNSWPKASQTRKMTRIERQQLLDTIDVAHSNKAGIVNVLADCS